MAVTGVSNRVVGMYSGLDTDTLIQNLVKAQSSKLNAYKQSQIKNGWIKETLLDINNKIRKLHDTYFSAASAKSLTASNALKATAVTGLQANAYFSVTASANANNGVYTVSEIRQLATGAGYEGARTGVTVSASGLDSTAIKLSALSDKLVGGMAMDNGEVSFEINGKTFTFSENDTLQTVMNTINKSDAGVTMSYSQIRNQFTISSNTTGLDSTISITNTAGDFFGSLGIDLGAQVAGKDAIATINGVEITRSSNIFTVDGLTFKLTGKTGSDFAGLTFSVSQDIDSAVNRITEYVTELNKLYSELYTKYYEKSNRNYPPLLDEQKAEMKDSDIALWTEHAKSGMLRGDGAINRALNAIRSAISDVTGDSTMSSIGISTGAVGKTYVSGEIPQIYIDEKKLRSALETDPDKVISMFTAVSDPSLTGAERYKNSGFMSRIDDALTALRVTNSEVKISGLTGLDRTMSKTTQKILDEERRLSLMSERYYKQFAAMEKALASMQSQSAWLSQQLGTGN